MAADLIYEMLGSPIKQEQLNGERVLLETRDIGPIKARASIIRHFEESMHREYRPASELVAKQLCVFRTPHCLSRSYENYWSDVCA